MSFTRPEAIWKDAVAAHEAQLDRLRAYVEERLQGLTYKRKRLSVSVQDEDGSHVQAVVEELRESGWVVTWQGDELFIGIPDSVRAAQS